MTEPFRGLVSLDIRESVPDQAPYEQPTAPQWTLTSAGVDHERYDPRVPIELAGWTG